MRQDSPAVTGRFSVKKRRLQREEEDDDDNIRTTMKVPSHANQYPGMRYATYHGQYNIEHVVVAVCVFDATMNDECIIVAIHSSYILSLTVTG